MEANLFLDIMDRFDAAHLDYICRLCLGEFSNDGLYPIFTNYTKESPSLCDKILACASVCIFEGDGLPEKLCEQCLNTVDQSFSFRGQVEGADAQLRDMIQRSQISNDDDTALSIDEKQPERKVDVTEITLPAEEQDEIDEATSIDFIKLEMSYPEGGDYTDLIVGAEEGWEEDDLKPLSALRISKRRRPHQKRVPLPKNITCPVCNNCVNRRKFKLHMMVHNGEKPHLCDICGKGFTWKFALNTHKRVHTGEKPYHCPHCGLNFRSSSRFAEHSTIHTGRRSYVCERCALAFRTSGRLKRHLRIHTGEKPYKCSFCERCFSESYNLKQHVRLHTGEKPPHACHICKSAFARKKLLADHLKSRHGVSTPPPPPPTPVINININLQSSFVKDAGL